MTDKYLSPLLREYFVYLDELRESGRINMAGAPRELREDFGIDKAEAIKIFELWNKQYTQREENQNE